MINNRDSLYTANLTFRSTSDPTKVIGSTYAQGTNGPISDLPTLREWSADGTLLTVNSQAEDAYGAKSRDVNLVSVISHKAVQTNHLTSPFSLTGTLPSIYDLKQVGPFYTMNLKYTYGQELGKPITPFITVQNRDGSDKVTLFGGSNDPVANSDTVRFAQVVQVP